MREVSVVTNLISSPPSISFVGDEQKHHDVQSPAVEKIGWRQSRNKGLGLAYFHDPHYIMDRLEILFTTK